MISSFFAPNLRRYFYRTIGTITILGLCVLLVVTTSCDKNKKTLQSVESKTDAPQRIAKSDTVSAISMSAEEAQRFSTVTVQVKEFVENLRVTARAVAATVPNSLLVKPLVVFEMSETAQIFSSYTKSKAAFERTVKQYERVKEMIAGNAASGRELLEAQTERNQAEAELREAESRLYQNEFNPRQLEKMEVGMILMMCDVPESRISDVSMGESVQLEFTSFPNEILKGRVIDIANAIEPQTRTIKISIELRNPKNRIKLGMFAKASIERSKVQAISIPHEAVVSADAKSFVFVRTTDSTFERRQVMLGADNGKEFELKSGVQVGEKVVISNAILLKGLSFGY